MSVWEATCRHILKNTNEKGEIISDENECEQGKKKKKKKRWRQHKNKRNEDNDTSSRNSNHSQKSAEESSITSGASTNTHSLFSPSLSRRVTQEELDDLSKITKIRVVRSHSWLHNDPEERIKRTAELLRDILYMRKYHRTKDFFRLPRALLDETWTVPLERWEEIWPTVLTGHDAYGHPIIFDDLSRLDVEGLRDAINKW